MTWGTIRWKITVGPRGRERLPYLLLVVWGARQIGHGPNWGSLP